MFNLLQETIELIDQIPQDVLDRLPPDVVQSIRDGAIDQIPEDVVDLLPPDLADRIPAGLIESAAANPVLTTILIVVGVVAALVFFYGIVKSAFKAALFAGIVGGASWYWYFNLQ